MTARERFANKKVVVTGAGTGISGEIILAFGVEGADVALHYSHSSKGAESAAAEIEKLDRKAACFQANFDRLEAVQNFADRAFEFLDGIDMLVNNAGITFNKTNKPFLEVTAEQYDLIYTVNLRAQCFLTQRAAKAMIEANGGATCNLTSIHGIQGAPEHSVYAGTKGAIIGSVLTLGDELAHKGVRASAIAPGWVMVENYGRIFPNYSEEGALESAKPSAPVGRPGYPNDIAKLTLFLCSDDGAYIVGQTIVADGGTNSTDIVDHRFPRSLGGALQPRLCPRDLERDGPQSDGGNFHEESPNPRLWLATLHQSGKMTELVALADGSRVIRNPRGGFRWDR